MPSVATGDRKQFQYLQIVLNNKTTVLYNISFGIQLMQRHLLAFYKVAKYRDNAPLKELSQGLS